MVTRTWQITLCCLLLIVTLTACQPISRPAHSVDQAGQELQVGQFAEVNGIQLYYEVYGEGEPLLLLHGGLGNAGYWEKQIPTFTKKYQVIAVDSRGHGRSTFTEEPISYKLMSSDVLALMDHLKIDKANLVGWSDGGIIGLDLAIHHRERLNRVVAYGANYNPSGVRADIGQSVRFNAYIEQAAGDYQKLAADPKQWDAFLANIGNMWATEPNYTQEEMKGITTPIMILDGLEEEAITTEHAKEMAALIPGSTLKLMEGVGHFAMWEKTEEFNQIVMDYLGQ